MGKIMNLHPFSDKARSIQIGDIYEHYSRKRYKILAVGRHSETLEEVVIYQSLYGDGDVWVRPLAMFLETVGMQPRFSRVVS